MELSVPLPTLYEYYTSEGIVSGLSDSQPHFTLNDRNITIYSGAMHYFRVPRKYWRDRLRKMRAAGLNTVETYVPWNLHEPSPGSYDFGDGGSDMQDFLHLEEFLRTAKEEDLLAIVRPGPFICSEWEFGGFPSWLLRTAGIRVRTSQKDFMDKVASYFGVLLPILAALQFTKGGPVVALQIENEYGSTRQSGKFVPDKEYLRQLVDLHRRHGIVELLFTSDSPTASGSSGTLPDLLLQTANFAGEPEKEFDRLHQLQPDKPTMSMEFWIGWFDHWSEKHHTRPASDFRNVLERILRYPASVNMYMFHGGTNWGFMNGANIADGTTDNSAYQPDTTSYDYDGAITEAGDYTEKYVIVQEVLRAYNKVALRKPIPPAPLKKTAYLDVDVTDVLDLTSALAQVKLQFASSTPVPMEFLPMNNGAGQSYGYIVYRKTNVDVPANAVLKIEGHICDTVMVLLNGILVSEPLTNKSDLNKFGYWRISNGTLHVHNRWPVNNATLELIVENWGRNNFGHLDQFRQFKGIWQGGIILNGLRLLGWKIQPLEFRSNWTRNLEGWRPKDDFLSGPALYRGILEVEGLPEDTFINMQAWTKGIVIVNGFVLGRYAAPLGPQQTLYLPAPLLNTGANEIVVFEHFRPHYKLKFSDKPIFHTP